MAGTITVGELLSDPTSNNKITIGSGTTLDLVNGAGSVTGAGKVLQVKYGTASIQYNTSSSSWATRMPANDVTITPSSSSSKILIMVSTTLNLQYYNSQSAVDLYRQIAGGATTYNLSAESRGMSTNTGHYQGQGLSYSYMDAPSTTSAVTYSPSFKWAAGGTGQVYLGRNDAATTVTVMEIQG